MTPKRNSPPTIGKSDFVPESYVDNNEQNSSVYLGDKLDYAALQAMDAAYLALQAAEVEPSVLRGRRPGSVRSNDSRMSRMLSISMKKRGKQAMERDETESVITSVSTHRSGRSLNSQKSRNKSQSNRRCNAITAENLAILNRINGDGLGSAYDFPSEDSKRNPKTSPEKTNNNEWWPKIF